MKALFVLLSIICLGSFLNTILAQSSEARLDQVALMKQFEGNWHANLGQDSVCDFNVTLTKKGGEGIFTYSAKGKPFFQGKQLWGYMSNIDRIIVCQLFVNIGWIQVWKMQFINPTKVLAQLYNIDNQDKVVEAWEMEFKSSDTLTETLISSQKKQVNTFNRVK